MHIEEKQKAINKVAALLKDGGRFVLSIDKNQNDTIEYGTRKIKIYPDRQEDIIKYINQSGMNLIKVFETEFAYIFIAHKHIILSYAPKYKTLSTRRNRPDNAKRRHCFSVPPLCINTSSSRLANAGRAFFISYRADKCRKRRCTNYFPATRRRYSFLRPHLHASTVPSTAPNTA